MQRALQLARNGEGRVSPNPMVGAVIVARGRIIGEGFHANYGGPHAEVNAVHSVADSDRHLLKEATMYVTLEPCAHYGKTPPCANLIVECGIPEVVIATTDPNPLVAGKGTAILENAGIKTHTGLLEAESRELNKRFFHAQTSPYPRILLKWAQSADGYMARIGEDGTPVGVKFSNPLSTVWMHRERANIDAILVGSHTANIDKPRLDVREWGGKNPRKIIADSSIPLREMLEKLRKDNVTSLMVEGGPTLLQSFINEGFYDEIRVEISPVKLGKGLKAPMIPPDMSLADSSECRQNIILTYRR